jgi:uncharacterized protein
MLAAVGSIGGLFSGFVGGGGGAVMIPLMTGPLKMRQHVAHGTSLLGIVGAATASAVTYAAHGNVRWALVAMLLAGSMAGAYAGAMGAQRVPAMRLKQMLGVFLVVVALRMLLVRTVDPVFAVSGLEEALLGAVIGFFGGLAAGALGIGGGGIFVPAMVLLIGVEQHVAQGVSLWVVAVTAVVGALTHYRNGTVDTRVAGWILPIAVPMGIAGSLVAAQVSDRGLRMVVAAVLVGIGIQMVVTATRRLRLERGLLLSGGTPGG